MQPKVIVSNYCRPNRKFGDSFVFSLLYLRGVADESIKTMDIYKGVVPFIIIQIAVLLAVIVFPAFVL